MLKILLNMICLGGSAFLFGFTFLKFMRYKHNDCEETKGAEIDLIVVMGLCILTVYAQFFSLFGKLGALAFGVVVFGDALILFTFRKDFVCLWKKYVSPKPVGMIMLCLVVGFVAAAWANNPTRHYDTDLYHAQAIRWLEMYGIVPGLGNLHNRFAYNSAFFALQALFSWEFLGRSLHAVNAFVYFFFMSYAVSSAKVYDKRKFFISDFLRVAVIGYLGCTTSIISSPDTDRLALSLVLYVLVKWVELWEENTGGGYSDKYAVLSLIALFAVSVKLSTGMVILLAAFPAVKLILRRDWNTIVKYLAAGIFIIAPFLIRNIVISGYLVYPYSKIDLFSFDWKMPAYTLDVDRYEIRAWGQGLNDYRKYNASLGEWFPSWVSQLGIVFKIFLYLNIPCAVAGLAVGIWHIIKKKDINCIIIICTMLASLLFWFTGAPHVRYGVCYMVILPFFMSGYVMSFLRENINKHSAIMIVGIVSYQMYLIISAVVNVRPIWDYNADYNDYECRTEFLDGVEIYVPVFGDQAGYYKFPSTPALGLIQMRGDSINDGFKIKDEFKGQLIVGRNIAKFNIFETKFQDRDNEVRIERDIIKYLELINDSRYTIFMSVKDDGANVLTEDAKSEMLKLGLETDLTGKFRSSYYAVISNGEIIEDVGNIKLETKGTVLNTDVAYSVTSAGHDCGNISSIIVNGKEYSINSAGLNIVVYNNETNQVIDTVCFDT